MLHETVEEAVAQLRKDMAASSAAARSGIDRAVSQSSGHMYEFQT